MGLYLIYYVVVFIFLFILLLRIVSPDDSNCKLDKQITESELNTGDLIFSSYKNSLGYFMRLWSNSKWTHVGMVYKDSDSNCYIMETAGYGNKYDGVILLPLNEWLRYNKNCEICVTKLESSNKTNLTHDLLQEFIKIKDKKLDTFGLNWIRLINRKKYKSLNNQNNITCYELVVHLLQEVNVAKKDYSPSSYFPTDLMKNKLKLNPGFKYSKPLVFKL
jgi:hypothetical protein